MGRHWPELPSRTVRPIAAVVDHGPTAVVITPAPRRHLHRLAHSLSPTSPFRKLPNGLSIEQLCTLDVPARDRGQDTMAETELSVADR
jgi:hypothetical protein